MNRPQTDPERKCRVTQDYEAEFPDPIVVDAGEAFAVSTRTSAWENNAAWMWVWCTDRREKSGWVPKNIIKMDAGDQTGTTHAAYNARELTVTADQELVIEYEESGWVWCRDQQEKRGWVPLSHILAVPCFHRHVPLMPGCRGAESCGPQRGPTAPDC